MVFLVVHVHVSNNLHLGPVLFPTCSDSPDVSLTLSPNKTIFDRGDNLTLTCSAQRSPDPTVTLTRERTNELCDSVQAPELTTTLGLFECLSTDVYRCSAQNSQGTVSQRSSIGVLCKLYMYHLRFSRLIIILGFINLHHIYICYVCVCVDSFRFCDGVVRLNIFVEGFHSGLGSALW